jgi:anti-repressor protein
MDSLIQITKNTINGIEINSINAREIHEYLKIKTPFSMWIKRAIEKYDFLENEDFTTHKFVNGKATQTDYIVSFDMAKELCIVEPNEKGKETRKYFISVEKQYQQQIKPLTINEQIALIAQGHQEVEQRLTQIEHKIENDITLTSAQKFHLKEIVTKKVFEIKNNHNLDDSFTKKNYQRIWKKLKNHFIVSSYMEIPKSKFDEAVGIVNCVSLGDLI